MNDGQRIKLMILIFGLMLIKGWTDNIRGVLTPIIQSDFAVNYTSLAFMMLLSTLGFILATFSGGILSDKIGQKKVLFLSYAIVVLSIIGISRANSFNIFIMNMSILGYGGGLFTVGASTMAPIIFIKNQAVMMNLLHFFYGVGATLAPRYAGAMLNNNFTWKQIYLYCLLAVGILILYSFMCKFPKTMDQKKNEKAPLLEILKDKDVIMFSVMLGFYVAAEVGIANWLVIYLQRAKGLNELQSASYLSIFYVVFTLGRLGGGFVVERVGYLKSIKYAIILSLGCVLIGMFAGRQMLVMIPVSGLFFSIIYPTGMTIVMRSFDKGINTIIGVVMTSASAINMITNWSIGRVNDAFGESVGFSLILLFQIITIVLVVIIQKQRMEFESMKRN